MLRAQIGKELVVSVPNEVGVIAKVAKIVSEKGLNIQAMSVCDVAKVNDAGEIHLITDNNLRAAEALRGNGYQVREVSVVALDAENRPGILLRLSEALARERINIRRLYGSSKLNHEASLIVLDTEDNERATILLND
ncbi:MAG: ACT domain-containing protein [Phycisphaeraceae bacterium]|nr:ACT domain-containing protein [Phycisphaeraceae bacterium]